jgi:rare lipoprotein A
MTKFYKTTTIACMTSNKRFIALAACAFFLYGCAGSASIGKRSGYNRSLHMQSFYQTQAQPVGTEFEGEASYYGSAYHGKKTASGEVYNKKAMTCAHKTLPFHTIVKVTLPSTGRSVDVRVNDRGPYKDNRVLDLSQAAAEKIGLAPLGVAQVEAKIIKVP